MPRCTWRRPLCKRTGTALIYSCGDCVYALRGLALERPLFCFCAFLDGFFRFYLLCWCCRLPVTAQSKRRINRINASNELVRQVSPNLQGMLSSETRVCKLTHCFEAS